MKLFLATCLASFLILIIGLATWIAATVAIAGRTPSDFYLFALMMRSGIIYVPLLIIISIIYFVKSYSTNDTRHHTHPFSYLFLLISSKSYMKILSAVIASSVVAVMIAIQFG